MSDYPIRIEKSETIYSFWESGEGDMAELAIGLYDLTAHYKALWDDYHELEVRLSAHLENEGEECPLCILEAEVRELEAVVDAAKLAYEYRNANDEAKSHYENELWQFVADLETQ